MSVLPEEIIVFADGAAQGNPGPGGWGALVLRPTGWVDELGGSGGHTTNNKMELCAAIRALESIVDVSSPVRLYTDSTYVIRGVTEWVRSWRRRGWVTMEGKPVLNRDLWERISALAAAHPKPIRWLHVRGHAGIPGNERADEIARSHAIGRPEPLFHGKLADYPVSLFPLPDSDSVASPAKKKATSSKGKGKPHSYLSLVDGKLERHTTWGECEQRVRGRSGARFKKALSAEHENEILSEWGVSPAARPGR